MNLVKAVNTVVDWLNENVCPKIELKLPSDANNDNTYSV